MNDIIKQRASDLEKNLRTFTSELKNVKTAREFNELIEGAVAKLESSRIHGA